MPMLKIDIVSDVACPWCPIGYKRLEAAMAALAKDGFGFDVEWQPFELAPDMPDEGEAIIPHLVRKYGASAAEMRAAQARIMAAAAQSGLNFDGALERRAVNTFDAHRVLLWAREQGRQSEFALALFAAYFGRAENPAAPQVLRRTAEGLGLEAAAIDEILASDRYASEVRERERRFQRAGIHSVPTFVVDGRPAISGVQPPEVLAGVLRQAAVRSAVA